MVNPVNWNKIEDPKDLEVWNRLTANFWLDTKVPVSNDLKSWNRLTQVEQDVVKKVFASLTVLDTLQSETGAPTLATFADTQHAQAVFNNMAFMESVHAKSYSSIFSTFCSTEEIDKLFRWAIQDDLLQSQAISISDYYEIGGAATAYSGAVILESLLFYSGFYAPLRFASEGELTNTADMIRLIMRDEGVHGYYTGYKYQKLFASPERNQRISKLVDSFVEVELLRAEQIYDEIGWTEDVKMFIRYNANKTLANMGIEPLFSPEETEIPAYILAALDVGTGETHDFFSGSGASYVMGTQEETLDEDWDY